MKKYFINDVFYINRHYLINYKDFLKEVRIYGKTEPCEALCLSEEALLNIKQTLAMIDEICSENFFVSFLSHDPKG